MPHPSRTPWHHASSEESEDAAHPARRLALGTIMVLNAATVLVGWAVVSALRLAWLALAGL